LNLPWSDTVENVKFVSSRIQTWSWKPGGNHQETLKKPIYDRLIALIADNQDSTEFHLLIISVFLIISLGASRSLRKLLPDVGDGFNLILFTSISSLFFWLFSAPLLRFGAIFFWTLFAISSTPFLLFLVNRQRLGIIPVYIVSLLLIINVGGYGPKVDEGLVLFHLKKEESERVYSVVASPPGEWPPLTLWLPEEGDQCGNSQIPCAPFQVKVKQRFPGDISKGFLPVK
jgi:hypothetical protein